MVEVPANISDDLYSRLRSDFSEEQLIELSAQIAFENFRARLNRVFNVPSDDLYHPENANETLNSPVTSAAVSSAR
jgi:hypothetical protein